MRDIEALRRLCNTCEKEHCRYFMDHYKQTNLYKVVYYKDGRPKCYEFVKSTKPIEIEQSETLF